MNVKFEFKNKKEARGIAANLRRIKKTIDTPEKWIKGKFSEYDDDGNASYCVVGAAQEVNDLLDLRTGFLLAAMVPGGKSFKNLSKEEYQVSIEAGEDRYDTLEDVYKYNDNSKRTHKQIMQYLDHCIAKAAAHAGNA